MTVGPNERAAVKAALTAAKTESSPPAAKLRLPADDRWVAGPAGGDPLPGRLADDHSAGGRTRRFGFPERAAFRVAGIALIVFWPLPSSAWVGRSCYDKLGIEQRIARRYPGIQGYLFRLMLDYLVSQGEKGLRKPGEARP